MGDERRCACSNAQWSSRTILASGRLIMTDLKLRNLSNFRLQAGIVIFAALAPLIWAQASRQLQVEVGTNQLVSILARGVSYGEVLKALKIKLVAWLLTKSLKRCGNQAPVPRTAPE